MPLDVLTCLGLFLGAILLVAYKRRQRIIQQQKDWSIAGVSIGMHSSLLPPDMEDGKLDSKVRELLHVQFDKNDLVSVVIGTTLDGPFGHFQAGQQLRKLEKKLGKPDWTGEITVGYYFPGILLAVSLYVRNRSAIASFHMSPISGQAAVEYEMKILATKESS